jgi:hypothetical protein
MTDGPLTMIGNGKLTVLDLLEVKPDTFKPEDVTALDEMARETFPEYQKRMAAHVAAQEYESQLARTLAELDGLHNQATQESRRILLASADEVISMTSVCDVKALAALLRPAQDQVQLLADAKDLLQFKRIPAGRIQTLEALLNLRRAEELLASIAASLSHAQTLDKLITAGIFRNDNRVAVISEQTEALRATAKEAARQVGLAEDALREERKRQATAQQGRMATGTITRAEVAASIPVYAGHPAQ